MSRFTVPSLVLAVALTGGIAAAPASVDSAGRVEADHTVELEIGDSVKVAGGVPQGINPGYHEADAGCSKAPNNYCEYVLVKFTNPYDVEHGKKGRERANADFSLTTAAGQVSDYDVVWYESDESGTMGAEIASAGEYPALAQTSTESATLVISSTEELSESWVLVEVVYFVAIEAYNLEITFDQ